MIKTHFADRDLGATRCQWCISMIVMLLTNSILEYSSATAAVSTPFTSLLSQWLRHTYNVFPTSYHYPLLATLSTLLVVAQRTVLNTPINRVNINRYLFPLVFIILEKFQVLLVAIFSDSAICSNSLATKGVKFPLPWYSIRISRARLWCPWAYNLI